MKIAPAVRISFTAGPGFWRDTVGQRDTFFDGFDMDQPTVFSERFFDEFSAGQRGELALDFPLHIVDELFGIAGEPDAFVPGAVFRLGE